ncbi:MAG: hypothetical protein M5R42_02830 [Rhodocyclaceae bacterium]|nr:hypothetical protein [Rhodocyclaceae bacterium]
MRGLDIDGLGWESFQTLPLLTRKALQSGFDSLRSSAMPPGHGAVVQGQSSGSTGTPVRFLQTAVTQFFWNALTVREHLWQERDFSGKLVAIRIKVKEGSWPDWGLPVAALFRTGPGATLNVRTDVERQLAWLVREDPDYLITHASNLHALAELSLKQGVRLPRLRPARTYSEALRPDLRETVRAAWGVQIADGYSCEEAGNIALQCPWHEHYHIQSENLLVEIPRRGRGALRARRDGQGGDHDPAQFHHAAHPPTIGRLRGSGRCLAEAPSLTPPTCDGGGLPVFQHLVAVAPIEHFGRRHIVLRHGRSLTASEMAKLDAALAENLIIDSRSRNAQK